MENELERVTSCLQWLNRKAEWTKTLTDLVFLDPHSFYELLGALRSNDADGNENVKLLAKQQLCTCTTLFCTFLCPFLHDYDVNIHNFAFYELLFPWDGILFFLTDQLQINSKKYLRTARDPQCNSNSDNLNSLLTKTISLGFFGHFSAHSPLDNSNFLLTRTKFRLPWSKFTPITRILAV